MELRTAKVRISLKASLLHRRLRVCSVLSPGCRACCRSRGLADGGRSFATGAWAQTKLRENFETADPSWRDAGGDTKYQIEVHQRTSQRPHSGASCEYVEINAGNGTYVHLSHDVGRAPVMAELAPSLWVRADRPGVQLLARVVLPHTTDPRTGRPVTRLLAGTSYSQTGRWQRLRIDNVSEL